MTPSPDTWRGSLVAVGVASAIPLLAVILLARRDDLVHRWVPALIFVAAGALLGAAVFHLVPESIALHAPARTAALVVGGFLALALLERGVHALERRDAASVPHAAHGHAAHLMPLGIATDALHNVIDGVLIATAFIATPTLGVFTGAAIALHELPRELGTFALCVRGGMSPKRAILVNVATGILAVLGAVGTLVVGARVGRLGEFLLPVAAGNFLYLAFAILWSERRQHGRLRLLRAGALVGVGLAVTGVIAT